MKQFLSFLLFFLFHAVVFSQESPYKGRIDIADIDTTIDDPTAYPGWINISISPFATYNNGKLVFPVNLNSSVDYKSVRFNGALSYDFATAEVEAKYNHNLVHLKMLDLGLTWKLSNKVRNSSIEISNNYYIFKFPAKKQIQIGMNAGLIGFSHSVSDIIYNITNSTNDMLYYKTVGDSIKGVTSAQVNSGIIYVGISKRTIKYFKAYTKNMGVLSSGYVYDFYTDFVYSVITGLRSDIPPSDAKIQSNYIRNWGFRSGMTARNPQTNAFYMGLELGLWPGVGGPNFRGFFKITFGLSIPFDIY
jgi:hypothetical protein